MKKYTHLFFDLDGTLWDLHRNSRIAMEQVVSSHEEDRIRSLDFNVFFPVYQRHNERVWELYRKGKIEKSVLRVIRFERAFRDCGLEITDVQCSDFADRFLGICPNLPHLIDGALDILEYCAPKYQLHIITNGFREIQGIKMNAGKIRHYFQNVVHSEDCGARKPNGIIFKYALEKAGCGPEECLMIGDDWEADVLGARNAGIDQAYLLEPPAHRKGRIRRSVHNHKPTFAIQSLAELKEII